MPFVSIDNYRRYISPGQSLLDAIRAANIAQTAPCGGNGRCGKCLIRITDGYIEPTEADREHLSDIRLADGYRLACAACPENDISIELVGATDAGLQVLDSFGGPEVSMDEYTGSNAQPFGIAVDIGTTTIGMCLVSLRSGNIVGRWSAVNRQREYGADVISRIVCACKGKLPNMSESIRSQLAEGFCKICNDNGVLPGQLEHIALAANTTMLHLLLELDCSTLGVYPFTPVTLEAMTLPYSRLFSGEFDCPVDILPGISTYVGADISSGILYSRLCSSEYPALLVDIGTNGEMALAAGDRLICTSTAAGPAFEGANIKWGTGSIPGAISSVEYTDGKFNIETIGNKPPIGICGSGIMDAVYQSFKHGLIDPRGRLDKSFSSREIPLVENEDKTISITQKDVRQLQLGKSAMLSGINILIDYAGLEIDDIHTLYLAGGFGSHLRPESAFGIGVLPDGLQGKTKALGNSALGGLVHFLLRADAKHELQHITELAEEFSLSERKEFNQQFIDNTAFPIEAFNVLITT